MVPHVRGRAAATVQHGADEERVEYEVSSNVYDEVTVRLIPEATQALARLAERTGMKKVDVVNRALQIYDYIEEVKQKGGQLVVQSPDGRMETLKIS